MRWQSLVPPVVLFLVLVFGGYVFLLRDAGGEDSLHGTLIDPPMDVPGFTLSSAQGPVALEDFRGETVVLFFGYTACPDYCPTTMSRLTRAMELLGEEEEEIQVIMVSVDPDRDTPERVGRYASAFHPHFLGLSGSPREIADVASDFGIYYGRASSSTGAGYLVDHSTTVTVLGPQGRVRLLWPFDMTGEEMAEDLRYLLRS
jgi:protein SCO1/2